MKRKERERKREEKKRKRVGLWAQGSWWVSRMSVGREVVFVHPPTVFAPLSVVEFVHPSLSVVVL